MRTIAFLIIALFMIGCAENKNPKEPETTRETVLIEKAKKEALSRLKSPSTAVFVDSLSSVLRLKGRNGPSDSYRVMLSVDAQNSLGTEIRKRYMIVMKDRGCDSLDVKNYEVTMFN